MSSRTSNRRIGKILAIEIRKVTSMMSTNTAGYRIFTLILQGFSNWIVLRQAKRNKKRTMGIRILPADMTTMVKTKDAKNINFLSFMDFIKRTNSKGKK